MSILKPLVRQFSETLVSSDAIWNAASKSIIRGSQYFCAIRNQHEVERTIQSHEPARLAMANREIIAGPFCGMKYGATKAMCSALYPKLLGTYENELAAVFEKSLARKYDLVVDIGAADGYYAVGFAYTHTNTRVIAYDQDPRARAELAKLATLNGVSDRIEIRGRCEPDELLRLPGSPGLAIVDCEGFEEHALTPEIIKHLHQWDFIIETHDGFVPGVTKRLIERFRSTHHVEIIEAIHDYDKADHVAVPVLEGLERREIDKVLSEGREHACLRWLYCTALA
jgi:predicted O-methyltransferase YrrM